MANAMKNHRILSILGCILKSELSDRGGVSKQIIWAFFILVDGRSLNTMVFMIIEKVVEAKNSKQTIEIKCANIHSC